MQECYVFFIFFGKAMIFHSGLLAIRLRFLTISDLQSNTYRFERFNEDSKLTFPNQDDFFKFGGDS